MTALTHSRSLPLTALAAAVALSATLAGCGGGSDSDGDGGSKSSDGVLTVVASSGTFVANFNPFAPDPLQATNGLIYEPLFLFNAARSGDVQDWLAEDYAWSEDGTELTITVRTSVTWSDGEPFTAKDVAYTFGLAVENEALNSFGLPIESATATDDSTVVLGFSEPALTKEYFILGKQMMVPEHIWSEIPDEEKTTVLNENPVGTGAWTVGTVKDMTMDLKAREDYYFEGLPHFDTVRYRSHTGNTAANAEIIAGKIDWAGAFIADVQKNYLDKDPNFDLVNIPLAVTYFNANNQQGPTAEVGVRKAISAALDREFMSDSVYGGEAPESNPMALLLPNFESVLAPELAGTEFETGEQAVERHLTDAGYTRDGDSWTRDGKKLSVTLTLVTGWTDYISAAEIAKQNLKAVGIDLEVEAVAYNDFADRRARGNFELLFDNYGYTPDPRAYYDQLLNSAIAPPIGEQANTGNYGRYENPEVDAALSAIGQTTDLEEQLPHYATIQQAFVEDMPLIPLFGAQAMMEFNGNNVTGYPTADDLYASPAIWLAPDSGWVAARLRPAE
jgi:peptide/nickel transport system substrate-binding protein